MRLHSPFVRASQHSAGFQSDNSLKAIAKDLPHWLAVTLPPFLSRMGLALYCRNSTSLTCINTCHAHAIQLQALVKCNLLRRYVMYPLISRGSKAAETQSFCTSDMISTPTVNDPSVPRFYDLTLVEPIALDTMGMVNPDLGEFRASSMSQNLPSPCQCSLYIGGCSVHLMFLFDYYVVELNPSCLI